MKKRKEMDDDGDDDDDDDKISTGKCKAKKLCLSLLMPQRHVGEVVVELHSFLISALGGNLIVQRSGERWMMMMMMMMTTRYQQENVRQKAYLCLCSCHKGM
jgi:hypothetical protein